MGNKNNKAGKAKENNTTENSKEDKENPKQIGRASTIVNSTNITEDNSDENQRGRSSDIGKYNKTKNSISTQKN